MDTAMTEETFRLTYEYHPTPKRKFREILKQECLCTKKTLPNLFPIIKWLPRYKLKTDLLGDVIAGMTVAVMHIPHGLAYSQLGNVQPVVGLYMAVFPLVVYVLMSTSRHISIGTFAVLCAMVGDIVSGVSVDTTPKNTSVPIYTNVEIATSVCLMVGVWQTALALLRLGSLTVFLSTALVSGFTTGAAFHVLTYQFKNLLGIDLKRFSGPLKLIYIYMDLFGKIDKTNLVTLTISVCFCTVLLVFNYGFKPLIRRKCPKCRVPVPIELSAVVVGVLVSYFMELNRVYDVKIVASVPTGLPMPAVPPPSVLPYVILPSFSVTVVAISVNLSLATIFSKKDGYSISGKQEILAYGIANIFSCFFQCLPSAASLSRSVIQFTSGGKTQLSNVFSMIVIVLILLFMGPLFEPVPYSVLSSIVVATIAGLLLQVLDVPKMFRQSYLDGLVWVITFLSVVIIDIDYGLLIGFVASVGTVIILNHKPQLLTLGRVSGDGAYLDADHFDAADEIPNVVITRVIGSMNFANDGRFQHKILGFAENATVVDDSKHSPAVILDLSGVSYIDPTAAAGLLLVGEDLKRKGFRLFLASCNVAVYSSLEKYDFFSKFDKDDVFAFVDDAVQRAKNPDPVPN